MTGANVTTTISRLMNSPTNYLPCYHVTGVNGSGSLSISSNFLYFGLKFKESFGVSFNKD